MSEFVIRPMRAEEVQTAVDWAADEGWNPGEQDSGCFLSVDSRGFWGGFLKGRMIASISVVNYDDGFAFLGFYIVRPEFRGQGYGLRLWQRALEHCGDRSVDLDGVVDQQENYRKSGFKLAYRNIRHGGPVGAALELGMKSRIASRNEATPSPVVAASPQLIAFDQAAFPAPRRAFLQNWLSAPGHISRAVETDGEITGYGTLRPCRSGYKIGPLFAEDAGTAQALLVSLLSEVPPEHRDQDVFLDTPEPNPQAVALATGIGLVPVFETARMYTGPAPDIDLARVFGVTTFELG